MGCTDASSNSCAAFGNAWNSANNEKKIEKKKGETLAMNSEFTKTCCDKTADNFANFARGSAKGVTAANTKEKCSKDTPLLYPDVLAKKTTKDTYTKDCCGTMTTTTAKPTEKAKATKAPTASPTKAAKTETPKPTEKAKTDDKKTTDDKKATPSPTEAGKKSTSGDKESKTCAQWKATAGTVAQSGLFSFFLLVVVTNL